MQDDTLYDKVTLPYTDVAPKGGETPFFLVLLLLVFFPPAAWYVMWKEEHYHRWFAYLIGIYGLLTIIGSFIILQILLPWSNRLYASLNLEQPAISPFAYTSIYIVLGVIEIILAAILFMIGKKHRVFPRHWLIVAFIALVFNSLISPLTQTYLTWTAINNLLDQSRPAHLKRVSPTPSPTEDNQTTNLKTYADERTGFSFQYPKDWIITDCPGFSGILLDNKPRSCATEASTFKIVLIPDSTQSTSFSEEKKRGLVVTEKTVMIDGEMFTQAKIDGRNNTDAPAINFVSTKIRVRNQLYRIDLYDSKQQHIYDQILSSFKFTDQTSISPTCRPRPACLDSEPKCAIPETPDMCPKPN